MKIKRLRVYGCSHTLLGEPHKNNWQIKDTWGYHLAKHFNLEYIHCGYAGWSNYHIFRAVYNDLDDITDTDLVFVQWSYTHRAWAYNQPSVMPHNKDKLSNTYFKHLYHELQEINKVLGYTIIIDKKLDNFVFNFFEGDGFFNHYSRKTWPIMYSMPNYLNVNNVAMNEMFTPDTVFRCNHLNEQGHYNVYELYKKALTEYLEEKNE